MLELYLFEVGGWGLGFTLYVEEQFSTLSFFYCGIAVLCAD